MQRNRGNRDPFFDFGDPFGGFGGHRNLMSSFFGGRQPFDDPFFTQPFGGMFESTFFGHTGSPFINNPPSPFINNLPSPFISNPPSGFPEHQVPQNNRPRGPIIEELNSDDEKEEEAGKEEKRENPRKHGRSTSKPYIQEPDEEAAVRRSKQMQYRTAFSSGNNTQSLPQGQSFTFQSSSVTYGGANGAYYTSSRTRRTGSDGFTFEDSKEADSASGQATHKISRGINNKGHSVMRKLKANGRVDAMQTLHNLNEDELAGFDQAWKGNARNQLPGWTDGLNANVAIGSGSKLLNGSASRGGWALPSSERSYHSGDMKPDFGDGVGPSNSQNRRTLGDSGFGRESFQGRSRAAGPSNMDRVWRR